MDRVCTMVRLIPTSVPSLCREFTFFARALLKRMPSFLVIHALAAPDMADPTLYSEKQDSLFDVEKAFKPSSPRPPLLANQPSLHRTRNLTRTLLQLVTLQPSAP